MKCFETGFHADFTNHHSKVGHSPLPVRELPDKMSASVGGHGKADVVGVVARSDQYKSDSNVNRGSGSKNPKILWTLYLEAPEEQCGLLARLFLCCYLTCITDG